MLLTADQITRASLSDRLHDVADAIVDKPSEIQSVNLGILLGDVVEVERKKQQSDEFPTRQET